MAKTLLISTKCNAYFRKLTEYALARKRIIKGEKPLEAKKPAKKQPPNNLHYNIL